MTTLNLRWIIRQIISVFTLDIFSLSSLCIAEFATLLLAVNKSVFVVPILLKTPSLSVHSALSLSLQVSFQYSLSLLRSSSLLSCLLLNILSCVLILCLIIKNHLLHALGFVHIFRRLIQHYLESSISVPTWFSRLQYVTLTLCCLFC